MTASYACHFEAERIISSCGGKKRERELGPRRSIQIHQSCLRYWCIPQIIRALTQGTTVRMRRVNSVTCVTDVDCRRPSESWDTLFHLLLLRFLTPFQFWLIPLLYRHYHIDARIHLHCCIFLSALRNVPKLLDDGIEIAVKLMAIPFQTNEM